VHQQRENRHAQVQEESSEASSNLNVVSALGWDRIAYYNVCQHGKVS
jgi:hypothetical protein